MKKRTRIENIPFLCWHISKYQGRKENMVMSSFRVYEDAKALARATKDELREAFNQAVDLGDDETAQLLDTLTPSENNE